MPGRWISSHHFLSVWESELEILLYCIIFVKTAYLCVSLYVPVFLCRCGQDVFSVGLRWSTEESRGAVSQRGWLFIVPSQLSVGCHHQHIDQLGVSRRVFCHRNHNRLIDNIIYNLLIKGHLSVVQPHTEFPLMTCASPHHSYLGAFNINVFFPLIF